MVDGELYGKEVARTHGMMRTSGEEDQSYEVSLVVRPTTAGTGRLVKEWRFSSEERAVDKCVRGYVQVDSAGRVATVSVTGLKRQFQERVNLPQDLFER
jgi:hypothetical protein